MIARPRLMLHVILLLALVYASGCASKTREEHGNETDPAGHEDPHPETGGRIELRAEAVEKSGIQTGLAAPSTIQVLIEAPGEVRLNNERAVQVRPPYAGQIRQLHKQLGSS